MYITSFFREMNLHKIVIEINSNIITDSNIIKEIKTIVNMIIDNKTTNSNSSNNISSKSMMIPIMMTTRKITRMMINMIQKCNKISINGVPVITTTIIRDQDKTKGSNKFSLNLWIIFSNKQQRRISHQYLKYNLLLINNKANICLMINLIFL